MCKSIMDDFEKKFLSGLSALNYFCVEAWLFDAIKRHTIQAQIEAYDKVRRLAHNSSHKQYASEQIERLKGELNE